MKSAITLKVSRIVVAVVLAASTLFTSFSARSQCNVAASLCQSGVSPAFGFIPTSGPYAGGSFVNAGCNTGAAGNHSYAFITLYITQTGALNLLIDGNSTTGFIDVAIFNIPTGVAPCNAIQSSANVIGCNYASSSGGCVQFGNAFGCNSPVPAPTVYAGQQLMIIAQNYTTPGSSSFTLQLSSTAGSAQSGPPNPTINPAGPFCTTSASTQLTAVNQGGTWSGPGVSSTGIFNPAAAGPGTHNITYSIGVAPCNSTSTSSVLVYANTPPTVTPSTTICGGGSTTLTASGATTYTWSPATGLNTTTGPTVIASPTVTTTYTVTGTTAGCSNSATTTVTISPPLTINVPPATICAGSSATLTATGATNYTWSPATGLSSTAGSSVTASPPTTTTYTVTGTTGACTGTTTSTVTVNPQPTINVSPITICAGSSGTLTASGATSYTWSPATGLSATTGASVTANPGTTTTYTVTGTTGSCSNTGTATVTVNSTPTATATPSSQTICSGNATNIALTSVPAGATFNWTVAQSGVSGASNGTGTSIAQTLTATGATAGTATYTITPTIGSCPGAPITVTITVNPTPVLTATPASQTICSGTAPNISLTSVPAGATFDWTVAQTGTSGASNGSGTSISQTLTATGGATGTATYTITPTIGSCPGTPVSVPITVNPAPVATATPAIQTICSGTATGITLTSVPAGATFSWTVAQSGVTGASNGNGTSINQTLSTSGATSGTATYIITPAIGTCPGAPITVTITVNPTPVVTATPASQTICSGTAPSITLSSVPAGATFSWTISQTGASGASNGNGTTISQVLTATGSAAGNVTYSVVPVIGTCPGTPLDVPITVNPTPVVTATPASQTICSGTSTGIALSSVPAGATFDWTVVQSGVTGASNGNGTSINQTLSTSGTVSGTATYTVTPMLGSCPGTPITVTITVNPVPVVTATPASQTICSGTAPSIALTSVPAGATFDWTVVQSGVTGASNGNGTSISQTLTASGATAGTATYTITPTIGTCPGTPVDVIITVNPTPVVTATPASQTICSGTSTGISLTSVPAGATFDWTVVQSGVTGASNGSGTSINQTLSTSGTASGTATYTVTPTLGSCPGTPITVTITVNPVPVVTATPTSQTICSGTAPNISLTSVPAGATFDWTVVQSGVTGASTGSGTSINQTLTAPATGTATYTITPTIGTCPGTPVDVVITVNPTPVVTATPASQTICSGTSTGIMLSSVPAGATFDWTVVQSGVTGASNGSGTSISQTLTASATGTATYTITPTIGTCPGTPINVVITVNPTPVITATPTAQTICSGTSTGIALSSVPAGATFDWTVVQSGVTGASAGNGTSISQTLTAPATGTATYTITPTIGTCPGTPIDVVITVNPTPVVTATPAAQTICSGTSTGITLSSVPAGATFDWTVVQSGVTGASNGSGTSINQTLTASATGTATYTITPTIGTCPGTPVDVVITVNPTPVLTATPTAQTICSGTSTGIALSSVPAGATFDWTVVQSGVTGASNGNGTSINQTLTASATGTATYTITPTIGSCPGTPVDVVITVNPTPVLTATPTAQTICSGTAPNIALSSVPAGATFSWTISQTGAGGASNGTGSTISQTLTATGSTAGTVVYTVVPTIGTCPGTPVDVTITVNPTPVITATPTAQTICSGTSTGIALSSVPAGATFDWTVVQSGVTGASAGNGTSINQTLTAPATGTATYTITPTIGTCPGTPVDVVITVNPTPVITATPTAQTICSGTSTGITLSSVPAGATFDWTVVQSGVTGASNGSGTSINQTLTASATGTATYTITPTIGTCPGTPVDVVITVNPTPVVTATPAAQTICSGTSTGIALSSVPAGATFDWTIVQSGVAGASAGSGTAINQTLTASATGTATYTITPTIGTCPGTPVDVVITVNPTPVITATPTSQTICSGTSTGITLTSVPAGATFDWTVVQSGTTGAFAGSGSAINQVLSTAGVTGTATYTITPTLGVCPGTPVDVVITVNPTPVVTATPAAQTICSGTSTGIALTSVPAGATFDWTVVQTGVTGASSGTGTSINQTLNTSGTVSGTAVYTVTPTIGTCPGAPVTVTIAVDPTPVVTATPPNQTICSGTSTGIALSSVPAGATFDWTVVQSGVTGAAAGSGNAISQVLSTAGVTGTATYTITPTLGVCPGTPVDVVITVSPTPVATATPASQTICSGTATGIALSSVPAGATFDWTVAQTGVTGASNGSGTSISQTLNTSGLVSGTATYTVTPSIGTCIGAPITVTITVDPTPVVTATPASQTICSGTSTGIALTSVPTGSTFDWTVVQSGVTGASAGSGANINQVLSTSGTVQGTATYTITPTLGVCPGTPITVTITVNPVPVVTATPASQAICSGTSTNIALTSVPAGANFSWTISQTGASGASNGSGNTISQTLTATGTVAGTVVYSVTPMLGTCPGTPVDVTITVNPTPVITATPTAQTICSGTSTGIALTSVPAGATFNWTVAESGTTGASAGSGNNIAQVLNTSGTVTGTATYTVTPTLGVCPGTPIDVVITVSPVPVATATPANQTICSGTATGIVLTSVPAGATFDWVVAQSGVTGATDGSGSSINQTLTTSGTTAGTATYTITPLLGVCEGLPVTVTINVNPTPVVTATPAAQTICSGTSTNIALSSVPAGATFDWTVAQSGGTGASAGSGNTISQVLSTGTAQGTATYTITPTLGVCPGTPITVTITVNPVPVVTATPASQTICSGTAPSIALTSVPAGATFDWTAVQSGTTGASAGSGNTINQVLSTAGVTGTATYTVTPTLGICPGTPVDVVITVSPTPVATATLATQTICSGNSTGISLTSVPAGATFDWTVVQNGTTGAAAGSGSNIAQVLSTSGTTAGTATYTITPTIGTCPGAPITVTITVNPTPVVTATPASQTICSGTSTGITLTSVPAGSTFDWTVVQSGVTGASAGTGSSISQVLSTAGVTGTATYTITPTLGVCPGAPIDVVITVNPTPVATATPASQTICSGTATGIALSSVPAGATFDWTVAQNGTTGASAGSGNNIAQVLSTSGTAAGTATYTVTPTIGSCSGAPVTVTITVNPTPVVTATPASQTICSGTAPNIALTSVPAGSTFDWTVVESGVTGASAGSGTSIAQVLNTSGTTQGTATYTITPTLGVCPGAPITVTITVNPVPVVTATPASQTICSGTAPSIALTSVPTGSTFDWTVVQSGVTGASAGSGSAINQVLTASGSTAGTATYTVTPTLGVCEGLPVTVTITVNPTPVVTATPTAQTICSGTAPSIALTSVPAGATFDWTVVQSGTTGASAGTGNTINQVLTASGAATGTATYSITPTLSGCAGLPLDVIITVNPLPAVVSTPASQSVCSGQATSIALTSLPAGATFTWTTSGGSGSSNGSGASIAQTLTNTGTSATTVTYTITPSLAGCTGPVSTVAITVNPNPVVIATPALPNICAGSSVTLSATGAVNYSWTPATGLSSSTGSPVDASPAATQNYAVTGTDANGCQATANIIVTVNPIPVTVASGGGNVCAGGSMSLSASGATSYTWSPATGLNTTTGANVTATPAATTTYTVTGTSLGCSSTATVTVTVNALPVVNAGADITVCNGEQVVFAGSGDAVSYIWSGGVSNGTPFTATATNVYTVVGTGQNGCTASDNVTLTVVNAPVINVVPSTSAGCAPVNVTFQNNTQGAVSYSWDFGDGTGSSLANPIHTYMSTGCFDVTVTASTAGGCTSTATFPAMVCVEPSPTAAFLANPSTLSLDNPVSSMINLSENASSYSWDFGDGSPGSTEFAPVHTFPDHSITNYEVMLVAYSPSGCTDTAWTRIEMFEDIVYFVPNSFTPDGDNYNQVFKPVFTSGFDPYAYTLLIYNRWGEVIFESHDAEVGWSGTYGAGNEIVMDGTYVWVIEFKVTQSGERRKINGHVNVLR